MFVLTTSMPDAAAARDRWPRPCVVNPGMKTRASTSRGDSSVASSAATRRRAGRRSRTRTSGSMPAPSSSTSMTTWLPFWNALSAIVPTGACPTRRRSSRASMPWSIALRIMCISGSLSSSTMSLSISVSAPVMTRFTCLSCSREIWRTTRASLSKTCPSGTMRTSRMPLCICARCRSKVRCSRVQLDARARAASAAPRRTRSARSAMRRPHDGELADDVHQVVELADVDAHRLAHRAQRQLAPRLARPPPRGPTPGDARRAGRRRPREPRRRCGTLPSRDAGCGGADAALVGGRDRLGAAARRARRGGARPRRWPRVGAPPRCDVGARDGAPEQLDGAHGSP